MRLTTLRFFACASALCAMAACTTTVNNTTNNNGTGTGTDAGSTTTGDKSTNTGSVSVKGSDGTSTDVKASAPASKDSTSGAGGAKQLGAMATDKILTLYISDATSLITITIDTDKYPLPATGIKAGATGSGAEVVYVGVAGSFSSDGTGGTIDVSNCPSDANNTVTVGTLKDVVVSGVTATGAGKLTLNGTFNLVYFGGYGNLKCTAPAVKEDAGSTTDTGPTTGGSCGYTQCTDPTKNCCPYGACLAPCVQDCAMTVMTCMQNCAMNPMDTACPTNCLADEVTCDDACMTKCNVSAACKTAYSVLSACTQKADSAGCGAKEGEAKDTCEIDACCVEFKAAF